MGGPNTGRPTVSDFCTQEVKLTGDKPTLLLIIILIIILLLILLLIIEDREGRVGSPLGDKSLFQGLLIRQEHTCDQVGLVFNSITIRRFIWGLKWNSDNSSEILSSINTSKGCPRSLWKILVSSCERRAGVLIRVYAHP